VGGYEFTIHKSNTGLGRIECYDTWTWTGHRDRQKTMGASRKARTRWSVFTIVSP